AQFCPADVLADLDTCAEPCSLFLHLTKTRLDVALLHLEVRDAVSQQTTDTVVALEHGNGVAGAGELLGCGETRRPRADDRDRLTRETLGGLRLDPTLRESLVDDRDLDLFDRHRRLVDTEHARALTGGRAPPARE